jgi:hypothetical protein
MRKKMGRSNAELGVANKELAKFFQYKFQQETTIAVFFCSPDFFIISPIILYRLFYFRA